MRFRSSHGFTMVELLVTVVFSVTILGTLTFIMSRSSSAGSKGLEALGLLIEENSLLSYMRYDLSTLFVKNGNEDSLPDTVQSNGNTDWFAFQKVISVDEFGKPIIETVEYSVQPSKKIQTPQGEKQTYMVIRSCGKDRQVFLQNSITRFLVQLLDISGNLANTDVKRIRRIGITTETLATPRLSIAVSIYSPFWESFMASSTASFWKNNFSLAPKNVLPTSMKDYRGNTISISGLKVGDAAITLETP